VERGRTKTNGLKKRWGPTGGQSKAHKGGVHTKDMDMKQEPELKSNPYGLLSLSGIRGRGDAILAGKF